MRRKSLLILFGITIFLLPSCSTLPKKAHQVGMASWYGARFNGRQTANGEIYDMNKMTAAHPSLAFGSKVRVVDQTTNRSVVVRINDRGPYAGGRIIDLSKAAARKLGMIKRGTLKVVVYLLD